MREKLAKIVTIILCVFVGVSFSYLVVGSAKVSNGSSKITTPKVIDDYKKEMDNIKLKNKQLKENIATSQTKLKNYKENKGVDYESIENELYNELTKYDIMSSELEIHGPGVEITMADSNQVLKSGDEVADFIIHDYDVLEVINELRFAGAEVIALNGYQLKWDSSIYCAGPVIYVDDDFIAGTPFKIQAIGNVDKMMATLQSPESYLEFLQIRTIEISMNRKDDIILRKN